jgi:hypothetical protein
MVKMMRWQSYIEAEKRAVLRLRPAVQSSI